VLIEKETKAKISIITMNNTFLMKVTP